MSKYSVIFVFFAILIGGFFLLNKYIYNQKQAENIGNIERYRGSLSGEYVCLPHKDTRGPQTLECAFGIKTEAGEYYAVDFNLMSQENLGLEVGDKFSANGLITPIEMLSTDHWKVYDIEGIFSVTDSINTF